MDPEVMEQVTGRDVAGLIADLFLQLDASLEGGTTDAEAVGEDLMSLHDELVAPISSVHSFEERGVLTNDDGLLLKFQDGSEFHITIVRSK